MLLMKRPLMNRLLIGVACATVVLFSSLRDIRALTVGDISFLGFRTDNPDQFSFVTWVNIAGGTQLFFTDESFDGTNFSSGAEESFMWTAPAAGLTVGQVVVASENEFGTDEVVDVGGSSSSELTGLSSSGDNLFVFQGSDTTGTRLFAINFANNNGWLTSGSASPTDTYLPASLNVTGGNLNMFPTSQLDNGQYTGSRTFTSLAAAKTSVLNLANWSFQDTASGFVLNSTDFTITPEPSSLAMLLAGGALLLRARQKRVRA
jgi:hypothetical protein